MRKITVAAILGLMLVIMADAEGEIVFKELAEGGSYICKMSSDGKGVKRLTDTPDIYDCPRWSPDGKHIIFNKFDGGFARELWMMDAEGGHAERLYQSAYWGASWSPDGEKIAFSTFNEDIFSIDFSTYLI